MADGRMLKKAISNSRRLAELSSDTARLIYTWLIPHLDVEGRFTAEPLIIKGNVFPRIKSISESIILKTLKELNDCGLIAIYEVDGDLYFQLRKFEEHQTGLRKEREAQSKIPSPPNSIISDIEIFDQNNGKSENAVSGCNNKSLQNPNQLQTTSGFHPDKVQHKYKRSLSLSLREVKEGLPSISDTPPPVNHIPELFGSLYNEHCPNLTALRFISKKRSDKIKARFKEHPDPDFWIEVFKKANQSCIPPHQGHPKGWRPDFDFIIDNDTNPIKILEEKYIDKPTVTGKLPEDTFEKTLLELEKIKGRSKNGHSEPS